MIRTDLTPDCFPSVINNVIDFVTSTGLTAYLVGGAVRDALLGQCPKDLDLLVFGKVDSFARNLAAQLGGKSIYLGQQDKAVWRIVGKDFELDLVPPRGAGLTSDLLDRDFTVNALAWSLKEGQVIDQAGGLTDLNRRIMRMVRPTSFRDDPIRLLRAFRLAAALDFNIEAGTLLQIRSDCKLIRSSAPERIRTELLGLLERRRVVGYLRAMHECGILEELLPQSTSSRGNPVDSHQRSRCFEVAFLAIEKIEALIDCMDMVSPESQDIVKSYLEKPSHTAIVKLSLLLRHCLHPQCNPTPTPNEAIVRRRLDGETLLSIQNRFALSNYEAALVGDLLSAEVDSIYLLQRFTSGQLREEDVLRFLRVAGKNAVAIILLTLIQLDAAAARLDNPDLAKAFPQLTNALLATYSTTFLRRMAELRFITGADLIAAGLPPGPRYREILDEIEAARIEGHLQSREDALEYMRHMLLEGIAKGD